MAPPFTTAHTPDEVRTPEPRRTSRRLAAAGVLVAILAVVAGILLRAGGDYTVTARLTDAGQIIRGNEVRIGAAPVGTVTAIRLADDGLAELDLAIDEPTAPLPRGTIARIRVDSLSGVANRFVSLEIPTLAPNGSATTRADLARAGETIPDGGVIRAQNTQAPVDLDSVLASLDAPTRDGLSQLIQGGAQQIDGRTEEARASLERLAPALGGLTDVADAFAADDAAFTALLREGAAATGALASRQADLTSLVSRARETTGALAAEQDALAGALRRFPSVLRRGTTTFAGLRSTLDTLDPLVADTAQVTDDLPGFLDDLSALARTGKDPISALARTVASPGEDDDATDLLAEAPGLQRRTRTAFPRAIRTMDASRSQVTSLREYTPDVVAALTAVGQSTANYDANGHYARIQPSLLAFEHDAATNTLGPRTGANPLDALITGAATAIRCPGQALGGLADGSAPRQVASCLLRPTAGGR